MDLGIFGIIRFRNYIVFFQENVQVSSFVFSREKPLGKFLINSVDIFSCFTFNISKSFFSSKIPFLRLFQINSYVFHT